MSNVYYTAERLNDEIDKILDAGFTPKTRFYSVSEGLDRIVIGNELPRAGYIRTYDEAKKFIEKRLGESYSKEEYEKDLKTLQDKLGGNKTYKTFLRKRRKELLNILKDAGVDGSKYSTKRMYDAVKEAQRKVDEGNYTSPKFYELLKDEFL